MAKIKNLIFSLFVFFGLLSCSKDNLDKVKTVTDYDGNVYNTVLIGDQLWMKENLRVTHFRNGDPIPTTRTRDQVISSEIAPIYQWPVTLTNPDSVLYGRYYTWYAATDPRDICPQGWHLPDSTDFRKLISYLGGENTAGGKLKEIGIAHWLTPNAGATNTSGFSAFPTGSFGLGLLLNNQNDKTSFWSSSTIITNFAGNNFALNILLQSRDSKAVEMISTKKLGLPVRCIKDN